MLTTTTARSTAGSSSSGPDAAAGIGSSNVGVRSRSNSGSTNEDLAAEIARIEMELKQATAQVALKSSGGGGYQLALSSSHVKQQAQTSQSTQPLHTKKQQHHQSHQQQNRVSQIPNYSPGSVQAGDGTSTMTHRSAPKSPVSTTKTPIAGSPPSSSILQPFSDNYSNGPTKGNSKIPRGASARKLVDSTSPSTGLSRPSTRTKRSTGANNSTSETPDSAGRPSSVALLKNGAVLEMEQEFNSMQKQLEASLEQLQREIQDMESSINNKNTPFSADKSSSLTAASSDITSTIPRRLVPPKPSKTTTSRQNYTSGGPSSIVSRTTPTMPLDHDDRTTASMSSVDTPLTSNRIFGTAPSGVHRPSGTFIPRSIAIQETDEGVGTSKQLEMEIKAMEEAIQMAQQMKTQQQPPQSQLQQSRGGTTTSKESQLELQRLQIEEEIRKMEAEIQSAATSGAGQASTFLSPKVHQNTKIPKDGSSVRHYKSAKPSASSNVSVSPQTTPPSSSAVVAHANPLMNSIHSAAHNREQRLLETNGKLLMKGGGDTDNGETDHQVKPKFSMADMIAQQAVERDQRLAAGGEKKMRKLPEPKDIRKEFTNIAMDAANLGRLTRLNEHTIEAIATEKTPEQEWKSAGLLSIQWQQPNHMAIIHEAANLGAMTKKQERVVTSYDPSADPDYGGGGKLEFYDENNDDIWEEYANRESNATSHLNKLLELDAQAGTGNKKVETLLLGLKEENVNDRRSYLVKPMEHYFGATSENLDDVPLPKPLPPRIDPLKNKLKLEQKIAEQKKMQNKYHNVNNDEADENNDPLHSRPMTDIGHAVAEIAWERRTRLDRPGSLPRVKERCPCPYCVNPSPYQTYAYRIVENRLKASGEWEKLRRPLRMDDPMVIAEAKAAKQKYFNPSDLPNMDRNQSNKLCSPIPEIEENHADQQKYESSKLLEESAKDTPGNNETQIINIDDKATNQVVKQSSHSKQNKIEPVSPPPVDQCCACIIL